MNFEVYAGIQWVAVRLVLHALILSCAVFLSFLIIGHSIYIIMVGSGLTFLYLVLCYCQIKTPLLVLRFDEIAINNLFYMGVKKISLEKISLIEKNNTVVFHLVDEKPYSLNLLGMSQQQREQVFTLLEKINFRGQSKPTPV